MAAWPQLDEFVINEEDKVLTAVVYEVSQVQK